jgi:hypothetical protein
VQSAFVFLRVSLAARMVYLARACGPVIDCAAGAAGRAGSAGGA